VPGNRLLHTLLLPQDSLFHRGGTGLYLVGRGELALIDTGNIDQVGSQTVLSFLDTHQRLGVLRRVLITHVHRDHVGGLAAICQRWGPEVCGHPLAATALEQDWGSSAVTPLADGEAIDIGGAHLVAVHTPGHSADHLCFFETTSRSIFTGDLVVGSGTAMVIDLDAAMQSLQKLLALNPGKLYPGHGPMAVDGVRRIRSYIARRLLRDRQVLRHLHHHGQATLTSLTGTIYPRINPLLQRAAQNSLLAHLRKLEREGRVYNSIDTNGEPVYTLADSPEHDN
jgi:endoribonuclease LACTB2